MLGLSLLFALAGVLVGGVINVLADDLPARVRPRRPHCPRCGDVYQPSGWLGLSRQLLIGACPQCQLPLRRRLPLVEVATALTFGALAWLIAPAVDLAIYALYAAVLNLVIVIDVEHRLILHIVTLPTTIAALILSVPLTDNGPLLAVAGAATGFVLFYLAYQLGRRMFGAGALGFGDVTLAMTLGAMLGLHRIFFALVLGILLGGLWSVLALATGRMTRRTYFAYGPFLALGGLAMIAWGQAVLSWFTGR
jgi:prepilin signal peptidase PulO-like enzyme (type II secretory pathway)